MSVCRTLASGILVLILLFDAFHAAAAETPPPELQSLIESLENIRVRDNVPSVALTLVSSDEQIWSGALGVTDINNRRPATADTLYRIGSVTKSFTALALLLAQEQELLPLGTPLRDIAPDAPLANPWADQRPVTIAHLLEHTAGLTGLTRAEFDHSDPKPLTLHEALEVAPEARRSHWPPGLHSSYSNAGAGLAAYALEQASGQRYEDFVEQRLFKPLDMAQAGFFLDKETRSRLATGYDHDGRTRIPYWHMIFRAFGGIYATPREMGHLVRLLLNRGRLPDGRQLLSPASIERMEQPKTTLAARAGVNYGYGLGNYTWVHNGFVFHGHGGDGDGYLSRYGYNTNLDMGYFVTINAFKQSSLEAMRGLIEDYLTAEEIPPPPPPVAQVDPDDLRELTGQYRKVTWRFPWNKADQAEDHDMVITMKQGQLYTHIDNDRPRLLIAVDWRRFRRENEPLATIAFSRFQERLYLQGDFGNYQRLPSSRSENGDSHHD